MLKEKWHFLLPSPWNRLYVIDPRYDWIHLSVSTNLYIPPFLVYIVVASNITCWRPCKVSPTSPIKPMFGFSFVTLNKIFFRRMRQIILITINSMSYQSSFSISLDFLFFPYNALYKSCGTNKPFTLLCQRVKLPLISNFFIDNWLVEAFIVIVNIHKNFKK